MKVIIIIGIVMSSLNILVDIIRVIGKLLDSYEFDNSPVNIITDVFLVGIFYMFLNSTIKKRRF